MTSKSTPAGDVTDGYKMAGSSAEFQTLENDKKIMWKVFGFPSENRGGRGYIQEKRDELAPHNWSRMNLNAPLHSAHHNMYGATSAEDHRWTINRLDHRRMDISGCVE